MPKYLSKTESLNEIKEQYLARLGYISKGCPFIVPITYYYDEQENCIVAFSAEGHKIDGMRKNKTVCLYVDKVTSIKKWKSILVHGMFEELEVIDREFHLKKLGAGIKNILETKSKKMVRDIDTFSNIKYAVKDPIVYRIRIWDVSGRYM
ncbi:pyridoxamine 5'-phosphate oxidase family protein [uncultured Croceitalea sp.]|uniref:pyridoxamine 5'-phosphate oxidase family protein n=1 Tax=uncultured Croceitalea sp. TaxID=1798908 RepID=UPI00374F4DF3